MNTWKTRNDVATALGIADTSLCATLYGKSLRKQYRTFSIPKRSGGIRQISAPPFLLTNLQRKLLQLLVSHYTPKACAHGFVVGRSIVSNARQHIRQRHIVNVDLLEFFPSIHFGRVRGVFRRPPFSFGDEAAEVLAQICCRDDGTLPQGGAMSPFVSNLICRGLDAQLMEFAKRQHLRYSRYADDLTFSTHRAEIPEGLLNRAMPRPVPGDAIVAIVDAHGFKINTAKTTHRMLWQRQRVTGITVNSFPNLPRRFVREVQGALYAWAKHGYDAANTRYQMQYQRSGEHLENVLRGRLAYLKMVRGESDQVYRRLSRQFNRLTSQPIRLLAVRDIKPQPMRTTVPRVGAWSTWAEKYMPGVVLIEISDDRGIHAGTAFHVGHGVFATAGHNLISHDGKVRAIEVCHNGRRFVVNGRVARFRGDGGKEPDIGAMHCAALSQLPWLPTQFRLPVCGEDVCAIGFPRIPQREPCHVLHAGVVEALPVAYRDQLRYIQVSFHSGGGLSGSCLIDKAGFVVGIMVENVFMGEETKIVENETSNGEGTTGGETEVKVPQRPYGQAVPIEYFGETFAEIAINGADAIRALISSSSDMP